MVERQSPLGSAFRPGIHGNAAGSPGVFLSEATPPSIFEAAAWPGHIEALIAAIREATGLLLERAPAAGSFGSAVAAFSVGPGRYLVSGGEDLPGRLARAVTIDTGTITDISHGRTTLRVSGPRSEWVLSKLFAIDFSLSAFPLGEGRATAHHEIFTQIQRTDTAQFDLYVFRSFARSFWMTLCDAAEEVGYQVEA